MYKIEVHDWKDNISSKIDGLYSKEEESKLQKTFHNFVIVLWHNFGPALVVTHSHDQNNERKCDRKNREDDGVH